MLGSKEINRGHSPLPSLPSASGRRGRHRGPWRRLGHSLGVRNAQPWRRLECSCDFSFYETRVINPLHPPPRPALYQLHTVNRIYLHMSDRIVGYSYPCEMKEQLGSSSNFSMKQKRIHPLHPRIHPVLAPAGAGMAERVIHQSSLC